MTNLIISRKRIDLNSSQMKLADSGWGKSAMASSIVEKITYKSDDLNVTGYIAYPADISKKYPCIIWCRGGIGNAGAIDTFTARGIFGQLASWGYVVLASQYRGNDGGEGKDEFGGADINDVLNLKLVANELQFADTSRWGIEGWSRGGMMTYLALTKDHDFKAAIITGGIANLRCNAEESKFMKKLYETTMGNFADESFEKKCHSRSIINFAEKLSPNTQMLILHGTEDNRVLPHDSLDISYKLLDNGIPFQLLMLKGGDHFLKSHRTEVDRARKTWYQKYL